ncbi:MAG: hypothetical protein WCL30_05490 [Pseudomonadota bacterium]
MSQVAADEQEKSTKPGFWRRRAVPFLAGVAAAIASLFAFFKILRVDWKVKNMPYGWRWEVAFLGSIAVGELVNEAVKPNDVNPSKSALDLASDPRVKYSENPHKKEDAQTTTNWQAQYAEKKEVVQSQENKR